MRIKIIVVVDILFLIIFTFNSNAVGVSNSEYFDGISASQDNILEFEPNLKNYTIYQDIELRCWAYFDTPIYYVISYLPNRIDSIFYWSEIREPISNMIDETFSIDIENLNLNLTLEKQFYYISILQPDIMNPIIYDFTTRTITIEKENLDCINTMNNSIFRLKESVTMNYQLVSKTNTSRYYFNQKIQYYVSKDGQKISELSTLETNATGSVSIVLTPSILTTTGNYTVHLLVNSSIVFKSNEFRIFFQIFGDENPITEPPLMNEGLMNSVITFSTILPTIAGIVFFKKKNEKPKSIALKRIKL